MSKRLMVIDDEPEMLSLIKFTLERAGYEVGTCDNGRQAWDAIIGFKPDLLILDVMLPGIDGYSLQVKLAQEAATKDMPIIVLTSLEPAKTLFQKFPQVAGFMTKPFKPEELLENVQLALARDSEPKP
ncbi:MAG: response regulator [Elusimicrobia bacterium]|nr:response regulator [Elusimicrobiota bacterium]